MTFSFRPAKRSEAKPLPSQSALCQVFDYEHATGLLRWRQRNDIPRRIANRIVGKIAGSRDARGYVVVSLNGVRRRAHRIIWKMIEGSEPAVIDHANGVKSDNRICNLRPCTQGENCRNARRKNGKILPKGVKANFQKFEARIRHDKRLIYLGLFETPEEAHAAYASAAARLHGSFARLE